MKIKIVIYDLRHHVFYLNYEIKSCIKSFLDNKLKGKKKSDAIIFQNLNAFFFDSWHSARTGFHIIFNTIVTPQFY
jgi:hypothetical protein